MKKLICIFLLISLLSATLSACSQKHTVSMNGHDINENTDSNDESGNSNQTNDNTDTPQQLSFYDEYNVTEIGKFHNGLAPFKVLNNAGQAYGFIDIQGNVIINPNYYALNSYKNISTIDLYYLRTFENYNYIKTLGEDGTQYLIDKTGTVQFTSGQNNVTNIGKPSNGYFWIETSKEEFTGYVYTVTYYSALDMHVVATFENIQAYPNTCDNWSPIIDAWESDSDISESGAGLLLYDANKSAYDESNRLEFNIAEYDSNFKTADTTESWTVNVDEIEAFQGVSCEYHVSESQNTIGQIASVMLQNKDNIYYYATVDQNGNVLMAPQKNISFGTDANYLYQYDFCKNLCPAMDTTTGLWGYIDPYGNWKIQPQYDKAIAFSSDGYATVNSKVVIDTNGNVILTPQILTVNDILGSYKYKVNSNCTYRLTFSENGMVEIKESYSYGSFGDKGNYELKGNNLIIIGIGISTAWAINPFDSNQDGEHPIQKNGDNLIINGREWTKIVEE